MPPHPLSLTSKFTCCVLWLMLLLLLWILFLYSFFNTCSVVILLKKCRAKEFHCITHGLLSRTATTLDDTQLASCMHEQCWNSLTLERVTLSFPSFPKQQSHLSVETLSFYQQALLSNVFIFSSFFFFREDWILSDLLNVINH